MSRRARLPEMGDRLEARLAHEVVLHHDEVGPEPAHQLLAVDRERRAPDDLEARGDEQRLEQIDLRGDDDGTAVLFGLDRDHLPPGVA